MVDDMRSALRILREAEGVVVESTVRRALERLGIRFPRWTLLPRGEGEVALTYPLVVKVSSPAVLHKSDVGGVRVGIRDEAELKEALEEMRGRFPGENIIVEEMAPGRVEMIVGFKNHPDYGHIAMVGVGGFLAELYRDVVFRACPLTEKDVELAVEELRGRDLLYGYRGLEVDKEDFFRTVSILSRFALELGERLEGMDLNPMIVNKDGAWAVDVKMILK